MSAMLWLLELLKNVSHDELRLRLGRNLARITNDCVKWINTHPDWQPRGGVRLREPAIQEMSTS